MESQCELKAQGKPYPRTCPVCRLGPCTRMVTVPVSADDTEVERVLVAMENYRARKIAESIDGGEEDAASMWRDMPVPVFIQKFREDQAP